MPKISKRAQKTVASPIRKFLPLVLAAEKRGIKVFKLNVGQPDLETPAQIFQVIKKFSEKVLAYAPSPGISGHVLAWQKYYQDFNIKLKPENILITVGCAEAIMFALMAVTDFGKEVLIFEPFYSPYKSFAEMIGIKLVPITLKVENNFTLPNKLEIIKKISKKTKAIVVINPNNPTGTVWSKGELKTLAKIAKIYNLFIIADETYREIVFAGKPVSFLKIPEIKNQVIVVDSVSKRFSACGARIGCLVSYNKEVMAGILKFAQARLSAPTLEQYGLIPLLKNSKNYTKKITAEYRKRRDVVFQALKNLPGVICQQPQGAFYIIAKLPVRNSEDFVKWLLEKFNYQKKTVMVTPAEDFYLTPGKGKDEIRIAYVLNCQELKEAMKVFKIGLEKYQRRNPKS